MRADDIRKLYQTVDPATADEAATAANEAQTDPAQARRLLQVLYSLSVEDVTFAMLLRLFLEGALMRVIQGLAEKDDTFAMECAQLINELMASMATERAPVLRGRPGRTTKSA